MNADGPICYINRLTGEEETESVMGGGLIRFAYMTLAGRSLWGILFNTGWVSRWLGRYFDSSMSRRQIKSAIRDLDIETDEIEYPIRHYRTFNQFFARRLKAGYRPFEPQSGSLASPADGRLLVYSGLHADAPVPVKGAKRTLRELSGGTLTDGVYAVAIIRLCPADYHRFHFPCPCTQIGETLIIPGKYHSVNPLALYMNPEIFVENARHVTRLHSECFGDFDYIEVGAFGVGTIVETCGAGPYDKMTEKGYFKFGGSTVILIMDNNKTLFDSDLLENTESGLETRVRAGNEIAVVRNADVFG